MLFRFKSVISRSASPSWLARDATIGFILILCIAVLGYDIVQTWEARSHAVEQSKREVENLTWSASQHAEATFRLVKTVLTDLVERVEFGGTGPIQLERLRILMSQRCANEPLLEDLVLTNSNGVSVVDGRPETAQIDLTDREYFRYAITHSNKELYISSPVRSKLTGRWIIPVVQRLNYADGSFAGIMIATVEVGYFQSFYASLDLGRTGAIALLRDDGGLLIRRPFVETAVAGSTVNNRLLHDLLSEAASGTSEIVSSLDSVRRIVSYRQVTGYPLVVATALGKDEQLASWRTDAVEHLVGTILITFVLGFFGLRMIAQIRQRENALATAAIAVATNERLEHLARHLAKARDRAEQASLAKSRFLAWMSHELRTPLNGILGYARLLQMEGDLSMAQNARVRAMQGAGKHLLEMITCVLDLSAIEAEHVKLQAIRFNLHSMAAACLDLIRPAAEAKGLTLSLAMAPDTPQEIVADPVRLRQVLLNLLGNAAKFTSKGAITLRLRPTAEGSILRIEVADTGPGIPLVQRQRLFQEFERLEVENNCTIEGAGLGLALSARLTALMEGHLSHDDNPEGGSVFCLELPLSIPETAIPASDPVSDAHDAQPGPSVMRVLVVDDVLMNRDIASSFLRAAGHEVTCAEDGVEAVAAATHIDFDVVLMDVRMPRMDGLEATRHIRAIDGRRGQVPIIALTAQAFTDQIEMCRSAGMDSHLGKPFDIDTLLAAVMATLGVRHQSDDGSGSVNSSAGVSADVATSSIEQQLPVLNSAVFQRTAGFLSPEAVASYMQTIKELGQTVLSRLDEPDVFTHTNDELIKATHSLAGSAGLFGLERVAAIGRSFERAAQSQAVQAPTLANELRAAVEATLKEIQSARRDVDGEANDIMVQPPPIF